jgi:HAD superfamily hydrolase (TIGR01549 family)
VIQAVFFDVGETIVDETEIYGAWADWLGVPRLTFFSVLGAVIARSGHLVEAFAHFRPDFDLAEAWAARAEAGLPEAWGEASLYPDARPCLEALRAMGLTVGVAGNQTLEAGVILAGLDLPVDVLATSAGWGVEKPSAGFFERVVAAAGCPAGSVLYVGDRLDNDIAPAQAAGLATAFLRRGPWGHLRRDPAVEARCTFRLEDLAGLPEILAVHRATGG